MPPIILCPARVTKRGRYTMGISIPADVCRDADLHPQQKVKVTIEILEDD